jgi:hypothetical protein
MMLKLEDEVQNAKRRKYHYPAKVIAIAQLEGMVPAEPPDGGFRRQQIGGWSKALRLRGFMLQKRVIDGKTVNLVVGYEAPQNGATVTMDTVRELLTGLYTCIEEMDRRMRMDQEKIAQLEQIKLPPIPPVVESCMVKYASTTRERES